MKITISRVERFLKFKDLNDPGAYAHDRTPLDEDAAGAPLVISLTPPAEPAQTGRQTCTTFLNGLPFAVITLSSGSRSGLGGWTHMANNGDIQKIIATALQNIVTSGGNAFQHLNPFAIDDIVMVWHYSANKENGS
ncbi:MAG TPA: hypothetical protein VMV34_05480 [Terriglobia bacterium]|nr:hypothetical protein [Terriglobia bacterium]